VTNAPDPRLHGAWRATLFEAAGIAIPLAPVGRLRAIWRARRAAIAALLASLGVRQAAFTGAWNPCSRRHPRGWNRKRLDRLREATRRLPRHEGMGRACRPRPWGEEHLLIGAPAARCAVLARRFRQDAILVIRQRGPARMMLVRSTMLR
jgi:hypothetical protein